jgi:predicted DNA binding protein
VGLWEFALRASYDYPFMDLSRAVPSTPLSMWCLWDRELLHVPRQDVDTISHVEKVIRRSGKLIDRWVDPNSARLFLFKCTCERYDSPWNLFEAHTCWNEPPIVYQDGWASFRVISFDAEHPRALYAQLQTLGRAELIGKRELPLNVPPTSVWAHFLFGELTKRQANAFLTAARSGYYESPRLVTADHIAASLGIGRTTYEEHLRKAEVRLVTALAPYLELFLTAEGRFARLPLEHTSAIPNAGRISQRPPGTRNSDPEPSSPIVRHDRLRTANVAPRARAAESRGARERLRGAK